MIPLRRYAGAFAAALLVLLALQAGSARSEVGSAAVQATDVLLAFDTTGSMGPSIAAAQRDASTIVSAVGGFAPNTRFAVASFRDRFYPGGQYTLVTPMTGSKAAVSAAIGKLEAVSTTDQVRDQDAEAYNLLFNKSYTDSSIGWRAASRKIVVVIGDAEPHSAGAEGLAGCADTTHDWNNLSTSHELAAMRAAKRTLVMIRQSATATTSLACYATLATLAYEGGAARDGGGQDMGAPVLALLKQAYAPFVVTPQLASAVAGKTNGLTVRIANPNNFALGRFGSHSDTAGRRVVRLGLGVRDAAEADGAGRTRDLAAHGAAEAVSGHDRTLRPSIPESRSGQVHGQPHSDSSGREHARAGGQGVDALRPAGAERRRLRPAAFEARRRFRAH